MRCSDISCLKKGTFGEKNDSLNESKSQSSASSSVVLKKKIRLSGQDGSTITPTTCFHIWLSSVLPSAVDGVPQELMFGR